MTEGPPATIVALLLAAGSGDRLGGSVPKAFVPLCGRPLLLHSLGAIAASAVIDSLVMIVPRSMVGQAAEMVRAASSSIRVEAIVPGGGSRSESVRCGLAAAPPAAGVVVCHDAARPLASPELFRRVIDRLARADGVVPVVPSPDTVKRIRDGEVLETIPRAQVGLVQTPQAFVASKLRSAHESSKARRDADATDDAMLMELAGFRVITVEGETSNFKITTPEDLLRAELMGNHQVEETP